MCTEIKSVASSGLGLGEQPVCESEAKHYDTPPFDSDLNISVPSTGSTMK